MSEALYVRVLGWAFLLAAAGAMLREKYLAGSLTEGRVKPWEDLGLSRRTWYRLRWRGKPK